LARRSLLLAALAALVAAGAFLAWKGDKVVDRILDMRYGGVPPVPSLPKPRDAAEANLQDLDYLARLLDYDRSFSDEARVEFSRRLARLKEGAASMSRGELLMGIARALAVADNPHTGVERGFWRAYLNSAPVRFEWFAEGLFVVRARQDHAGLLGKRVVAIDGMAPELVVRDASRFFAGPPEHGRVSSLLVIESPEALHNIYPPAPADRLVLSLDEAGKLTHVVLPAVSAREAPPVVRPGRLLSPESQLAEGPQAWKGVLDKPVPPSLRAPSQNLHTERLAEDVMYLHLWSIRSDARGRMDEQIGAALAQRPNWRRILIDLRFDTGGDYPDLLQAMKALPSRLAPGGKAVVIIDNTTFSAAIITAALVKHFVGPQRTVIVGERPRDRLVFWAEGNQMTLPNSRIDVNISTGMHDWARGCRDFVRCHWPNIWHGSIGVGSVEPDVKVAWSFDDYRKGVDTVLERALQVK
jgi:hypothetical protein